MNLFLKMLQNMQSDMVSWVSEWQNRVKGPPGRENTRKGLKRSRQEGDSSFVYSGIVSASHSTRQGSVDRSWCMCQGIRQLSHLKSRDSWWYFLITEKLGGDGEEKQMCSNHHSRQQRKSNSMSIAGRDLVPIVLWLLWWQCIFNDILKCWYSFL